MEYKKLPTFINRSIARILCFVLSPSFRSFRFQMNQHQADANSCEHRHEQFNEIVAFNEQHVLAPYAHTKDDEISTHEYAPTPLMMPFSAQYIQCIWTHFTVDDDVRSFFFSIFVVAVAHKLHFREIPCDAAMWWAMEIASRNDVSFEHVGTCWVLTLQLVHCVQKYCIRCMHMHASAFTHRLNLISIFQ